MVARVMERARFYTGCLVDCMNIRGSRKCLIGFVSELSCESPFKNMLRVKAIACR